MTSAAIAVVEVVKIAREGVFIVLVAVEDGSAIEHLVVIHHHQLRGVLLGMIPRGIELDVLTKMVEAFALDTIVSLELVHKGRLALNLVHNQGLEQVTVLEVTPGWSMGWEPQLRSLNAGVWRGGYQILAHRLSWLGR